MSGISKKPREPAHARKSGRSTGRGSPPSIGRSRNAITRLSISSHRARIGRESIVSSASRPTTSPAGGQNPSIQSPSFRCRIAHRIAIPSTTTMQTAIGIYET
ncbi:MAG: hypothetical protein K0S81_3650 [Rhodospirillales bacterium]|nr:hypothetical protein [Rhodospirillales bacterium]